MKFDKKDIIKTFEEELTKLSGGRKVLSTEGYEIKDGYVVVKFEKK